MDAPDAALIETAAEVHRRVEPLHSMIYFAPETDEELAALGLDEYFARYFAQRAAAMGRVGPGVVTATFGVFAPALVARYVPAVWARVRPADVLDARLRAADRALRRLLGDAVGSPAVVGAAGLARRACAGASPTARPLHAAHAEAPWPDEPHLVLWHAATLLREYRGDAHVQVLAASGLSAIEALVTHTATGRGYLVDVAQRARGWSVEQWDAAAAGLRARGLLGADGGLTADGAALRARIEDDTTRATLGPTRRLGADAAGRLAELGAGLCSELLAAGAFPEATFAPGSDRSPSRA